MFLVLFDSDVEERWPQPLQGDGDVSDGVENNLSIQMLYQVTMKADMYKCREYIQNASAENIILSEMQRTYPKVHKR